MTQNYRFVEEWPENTNIEWWNEGRRKLNRIIKAYNQWQLDGFPAESAQPLIATIVQGQQTFAARDGGGGWAEELEGMLDFVESRQIT